MADSRATFEWSLERRLSLRSQSGDVAPLTVLPVKHSRVASHAVIPDDNSTRLPSDPGLKILREGDVVVQEFQQVVRLFFLESNYVACDCGICQFCILRRQTRDDLHCGFTYSAFSPVTG